MKLASLDDMKTRLEISDSDSDDILSQMLEGMSALVEETVNRQLVKRERTERFPRFNTYCQLAAAPVDKDSPLTVGWQSFGGGATGEVTALAADSWYLDGEAGAIHISSSVSPQRDAEISVTYTGGFVMDGATELLDFTADPAFGRALRQATIDLVSITYLRRNSLDAASVSVESLSASVKLNPEPYSLKLLKEKYRRY